MARAIVITSGKGGVGKTTVTANLGMHLAEKNYRVCMLDMDIGLNNLDVVMNMEDRIIYTITDVLENKCRLKESLVQDDTYPLLYLLSTGGLGNNLSISIAEIKKVINELHTMFDFILIDCPAGLDFGFNLAATAADCAILVATTDTVSLRDARLTRESLKKRGISDIRLVVNRVRPSLIKKLAAANIDEAIDRTSTRLIGIIPEDRAVIEAANKGTLLFSNLRAPAAKAYRNIARRICGESVPLMKISKKL